MADTLARQAQVPVTTECTGLAPVPTGHQPCAAWRAATLALFIAWSAPAAAEGFGASWTGDFATVASGGLDRGDRHMGLVELTFDDGFVFAGRGNSLHLSVQHVYGGGFSEFQVGDLQTVSNIDADDGTRLFEAWVEVPLSESSSVLLGRYDLNTEFDAIEAGGLFLSSSQGVGPDISQTGAAGPSIFPRTAFGVRLQQRHEGGGILRGAALDVEASSETDYSDTPFAGGPMLILEYERPLQSARVKAGAWRFTRSKSGLSEPQDRDSEYGVYASIEREFAAGFVAYGRIGVANAEVSRIDLYTGGGIVCTGGLLSDRDDPIGFAFGYARNGGEYEDAMHAEGVDVTSGEQAYELTWRIPFGEHLVLQPDVQYVVDPDTNPDIADALVLILRVELSL
jgi:porin